MKKKMASSVKIYTVCAVVCILLGVLFGGWTWFDQWQKNVAPPNLEDYELIKWGTEEMKSPPAVYPKSR
jgi:ABC-type proline/glycine betaine transport system permease subunit